MKQPALHWVLAVLLTLTAAAYQRMTGPTHPRSVTYEDTLTVRLPRNHAGAGGRPVEMDVEDPKITGSIRYRRYPTAAEWATTPLRRDGGRLVGELPHQPPAGKLEYVVVLARGLDTLPSDAEVTTIIRFRGDVPAEILIPHVVFMFLAMLFACRAGLAALAGSARDRFWAWVALGILVVGGLVLGPIVQKYAFGEYWTGVPNGWDLTDNKVAVGFLVWVAAVAANWRRRRPAWIVAAALVTLVVFAIPHSMMGSELDPSTGEVLTG